MLSPFLKLPLLIDLYLTKDAFQNTETYKMLSVRPPSCVRSLVSTKDGDLYTEGHFQHTRPLTLEYCGLKDEVTAMGFALSDSSLVSVT